MPCTNTRFVYNSNKLVWSVSVLYLKGIGLSTPRSTQKQNFLRGLYVYRRLKYVLPKLFHYLVVGSFRVRRIRDNDCGHRFRTVTQVLTINPVPGTCRTDFRKHGLFGRNSHCFGTRDGVLSRSCTKIASKIVQITNKN